MVATLTLKDRIQLNFLLPVEDSFENLILREEILDKIKVDSKEVKKYKIETLEGGNITFKIEDKDNKFKYDFGEPENNYIGEKLTGLSEKKKLNAELLPLYKHFVKGKK